MPRKNSDQDVITRTFLCKSLTSASAYRIEVSEAQPKMSQDRENFVALGHLNTFHQKRMKERLHNEKILCFFCQMLLKLHLEWKILSKDGHNQSIFAKSGNFLYFEKTAEEASFLLFPQRAREVLSHSLFLLPPSCAPVFNG